MDVSESLLGACRQVKGKRYYFYNGLAYQVIGVFRSGRDSIEPDSLGYYNLVATCQTANSNQLTSKFSTDADEAGLYWVDAGSQTQAFVSALNTTEHLKVTSSPAKRTFAHIIKLALSQQKGSIGLMAFTFFLMLVNVLVLLYAWLYRKRRETWIRRLNGASRIRLTWLLLAEYLFIVTLAFAVAVVIAVCLAAIPASPLFLFPGLGWQAIFIAYLGIIVVSLVSAAPVILAYLSRTRSIQMIGARG
jgi:ABC-type antimicrobial peptide transport system permease subunit